MRLNVSLLQDQTFAKSFKGNLKYFFETNIGSTEKLDTVNESSKVYVRGNKNNSVLNLK